MPEILNEWPLKPTVWSKYYSLFDGKIYKVSPDEFDCEDAAELKRQLKYSNSIWNRDNPKNKIYIRLFITADEHVIISKQPDGYKPKLAGKGRPVK